MVRLHDIRLVRRSVADGPPVQLLVGAEEVELETHGTHAGDEAHDHHENEGQLIPGLVIVLEEVGGDEVSDLTYSHTVVSIRVQSRLVEAEYLPRTFTKATETARLAGVRPMVLAVQVEISGLEKYMPPT